MILPDVFWDRMIFMALGCIMGFVLGLLIKVDREAKEACREVREVHEEVHELLEHEKHKDEKEDGTTVIQTITFVLCALLIGYATVASQLAVNKSNHQADCTQTTVVDVLNILGERSTYTVDQVQANKELQEAQADFISLVLRPRSTFEQRREALSEYFDALNEFTKYASAAATKASNFPIPKSKGYKECLNE